MKKISESKDFNWRDIQKWMRIIVWWKNEIKRKENLVINEWDIKIVWGKFVFKRWDIVVITNTQLVKKAWGDKLRNEVTFQVEREGKMLEKDWSPIEYIFMGTLLIHHLFPSSVSNLSEVLIDAREKAKWDVWNILELKKDS